MKRPIGISLIVFIWLSLAIVIFNIQFFYSISNMSTKLAISPLLLTTIINLFVGFSLAVAFGAWKGQKWVWWITTFKFFFSTTINGITILSFPFILKGFTNYGINPWKEGPRIGGNILNSSLFIYYLFKPNVENFFQFKEMNRTNRISILLGISLCIAVVLKIVLFYS